MTESETTYSIDPQICRQCGGRCCQGHPGLWSDPNRFLAIFFSGKKPSRDVIENGLKEYRLELRDVDGVEIPAPQQTDSGCGLLGPTGCMLEEDERPCQCLALEPHIDTLLSDDICCTMPESHGTGTARNNWRAYWGKSLKEVKVF